MFNLENDVIIDLDYSSVYTLVKSLSRTVYLSLKFEDWKSYNFYSNILLDLKKYLDKYPFDLDFTFDSIVKDIHKDVMRSSRLRKRIKHIIDTQQYQYFITYTFTDDELANSMESRKLKVKRFIKSLAPSVNYVGNIDYGSKNQREHYHFVVGTQERIDFEKIPSKVDCELITFGNQHILKNYIDKLAQHGEKIHQRYIYSRG